jgi:two-component system NtrC family sensor kinase
LNVTDRVAGGPHELEADLQRRLDEALAQQAATAGVLKVISRSTFDLQAVLDTLVTSAAQLCAADAGIIWLRKDDLFHAAAASGFRRQEMAFFRDHPRSIHDKSLAPRVLRTRRTVHIPDRSLDPEFAFPGLSSLASTLLGVPLLRDDRIEGVFTLTRSNVAPFAARQIELVESFADQSMIAIENTRLIHETREALERQTATADILKVIASSPSDVQPVFEAIATSANRLIGGFSTSVFSIVDDTLHLSAFTSTNPAADAALKASFPRPLSTQPWSNRTRNGEVVDVPDMESDPEVPETLRSVWRMRGFRALLLVPLVRERSTIGMISVTRREAGSFAEHHVQLLRTFADQAVIAIGNVHLFEQVQERTKELSQSLDDLRSAQDRLIQTEKLASLGQLTAGIAHEIKNPLNFVNNFAALSAELTDELNDTLKPIPMGGEVRQQVDELTGMLKENLQRVVQHGKRADSIVKNMLLHSRQGSGDHHLTDINALVDESLNLAYHGARAEKSAFDITIQRDFDPAAGVTLVYPQEITRVLLNLVSNGLYATNKRGQEVGGDFKPMLYAATKNLGDRVEIRIRDNGTGIPPEVREKMFNPFFTTKPAGEGTGLGLSMSYDIIAKQHGGTIEVDTVPGELTEFTIRLPRKSRT